MPQKGPSKALVCTHSSFFFITGPNLQNLFISYCVLRDKIIVLKVPSQRHYTEYVFTFPTWVKVKVPPRTDHEGPEREQMYSSNLPSTSAQDWGWVVHVMPRRFYPKEKPVTHCIGGRVGPRVGLDGCGKPRPHRYSIPGRCSP